MTRGNQKEDGSNLPAGMAAAWRGEAIRNGQRPDDFWTAQRMRIRARIARGKERRPRSFWWSAATVTAIFLIVLFLTPARPQKEHSPARTTIDADQELLLAVEHSLAAGTPEALEPLTLLVESSVNHNEPESISPKEQRHEN